LETGREGESFRPTTLWLRNHILVSRIEQKVDKVVTLSIATHHSGDGSGKPIFWIHPELWKPGTIAIPILVLLEPSSVMRIKWKRAMFPDLSLTSHTRRLKWMYFSI
jgi:hypothetical protein